MCVFCVYCKSVDGRNDCKMHECCCLGMLLLFFLSLFVTRPESSLLMHFQWRNHFRLIFPFFLIFTVISIAAAPALHIFLFFNFHFFYSIAVRPITLRCNNSSNVHKSPYKQNTSCSTHLSLFVG